MNHVIIAIAVLLIGIAKGGFAGAGGLVTPMFTLVMPTSDAIGVTLPLLMIADLFALRAYWRKWDMRQMWLLLPPAILGIVLGTTLLGSLAEQDAVLRKILGLITLILLVYKLTSDRIQNMRYAPRTWHAYVAGTGVGFTSALANAGGPPYLAYMLLQKLEPIVLMGTTTLFFALVNMIKLPGFFLTGVLDLERLLSTAWAVLLIPVGVWLGRRFVEWVSPRTFELILIVTLFVLVLILLFG